MKFGNTLHVPGYPDAIHALAVKGEASRRLADIHLHRADLEFAQSALVHINNVNGDEHFLQEVLWRSAIVHYFKCFKKSKSRAKLDPDLVYASADSTWRSAFDYFSALRDKHFVHDENSYSQCIVFGVLNPPEAHRKIADVCAIRFQSNTLDQAHYTPLRMLVEKSLDWVNREFQKQTQTVMQDLETRSHEELLQMSPPEVTSATAEDVSKNRTTQSIKVQSQN